MKRTARRPRFGELVDWRGEVWRVAAQVVRPGLTVFVSHSGGLPGRQIPPAEWANAGWDRAASRWVVPTPERAA